MAGASKVLILYERGRGGRPAEFVEFADSEWQRKFAALLSESEVRRADGHVFGFNVPALGIAECGLALDFPHRGSFQIEINRPGEPLKQVDLVLDDRHWDVLLEMIMQRRAGRRPDPAEETGPVSTRPRRAGMAGP